MPLPALPARIGPPRLLVFRQTARARQFSERFLRLFLLMFGGMSLLMFVLFAAIFLLAPGHPETSVALSALGFTLGMFVLMVPPLLVPLWLRRREASQRNRTARIALGREGILLTAGALDPRVARPDLIVPWDALAKVDLNVQTSGVFAALFVRRGAGLRLSRLLRVRSLLLGSRANLMLPSPLYERIMPDGQVGSPLPALPLGEALLYQANEPSAVDSPLMPSLTLAEALHWYSREPGRRAELAPLPPLESAQERIALELPAESASPAGRAIGVAAWAALALFAALLAEPLLVAALWPGHGHFTVYGVVMVVLTCGGLALVLAGGRGWRYALGGLGLVAGIVMQFVTRIVLDLPGSLDVTPRYVASPIPLGPSTPGWLLYAWIGVMAFAMAWAFVAVMQTRGWITRRRGPGQGYGANEVLAFAALVVVYALAPAAFDTLQLMAPQVFLGAAPAADLLLLPGLPALVLALAYLQGRARRVRLLTSGGMLVCGVLMLLAPLAVWLVATPRAMPGLDATHTGSVLLVYAALAVVAGALVAAEALWRLARGANEPPAATPS